MKMLYIIGNGFDIYHKIPSQYKDYRNWLKVYHPDVLSLISEYFEHLGSEEEWNSFERNLGEKDIYEYAKDMARESWPDFSKEEFRDRDYHASEINTEIETENICQQIIATFEEWVNSLPKGCACKKIKIQRDDSFFINFNYTLTLEELYRIPSDQILHIHGEQGKDNYILGHGKSYQDFLDDADASIPEAPDNLNPEEYSDWYSEQSDMFVDQAICATARQLANMQKDVTNIIDKNTNVFDRFKDVQEIFIFGFSFSDIDKPYLEKIISVADSLKIKWTVSFFNERDKKRATEFFCTNDIYEDNVKFIRLEELHPLRFLQLRLKL